MKLREFRVVAFEHLTGLHQLMSAERFEDLDDASRGWPLAGSILWVERQLSKVGITHSAAKFTLDQRVHEDGDVAQERERVNALVALQVRVTGKVRQWS